MSDDDRALIVEVRGGSEQSFNVLVDRHQQAVRTFLRRLLGNDADADDMAQETFLAASTHVRSFLNEANVRSWLCGIASRKAKGAERSWFRRRARDTAHHDVSSGGAGSTSWRTAWL
jgi:RNA polymerase sigma-70 factor (ECF subfamily)